MYFLWETFWSRGRIIRFFSSCPTYNMLLHCSDSQFCFVTSLIVCLTTSYLGINVCPCVLSAVSSSCQKATDWSQWRYHRSRYVFVFHSVDILFIILMCFVCLADLSYSLCIYMISFTCLCVRVCVLWLFCQLYVIVFLFRCLGWKILQSCFAYLSTPARTRWPQCS